jgi:hypothetical protein
MQPVRPFNQVWAQDGRQEHDGKLSHHPSMPASGLSQTPIKVRPKDRFNSCRFSTEFVHASRYREKLLLNRKQFLLYATESGHIELFLTLTVIVQGYSRTQLERYGRQRPDKAQCFCHSICTLAIRRLASLDLIDKKFRLPID